MKKNSKLKVLTFTFICFAALSFGQFTVQEFLAENGSGGKASCNLNKTADDNAEANICNGSFCEYISKWRGTNYGKCG